MALVRGPYGTSQIKGSIGATTFQQSRYGLIARSRTVPVNPNTFRQNNARQSFREAAQQWMINVIGAPAILAEWQVYAEQTPWTNKLGDTVTLAARSHYMRICSFLRSAGIAMGSISVNAPLIPGLPPPNDITITAVTATGVRITGVNPSLAAGDITEILLSAPTSFMRNFWRGPYATTHYITSATTFPFVLVAPADTVLGKRYFAQVRSYIIDGGLSTVYCRPLDVNA